MTAVPQERGDRPVVARSEGFPPIADPQARVLVLGSLPGQRSIADGRYYAHPQNAFWRIMRELVGAEGSYEARCNALLENRIAVWDVLYESVRPGSMDASIQLDTAQPNDFERFFDVHRQVNRVCFNGRKAAAMFARFIGVDAEAPGRDYLTLPSTSPAFASMSFDDKLELWQQAFELGG